MRNRKSANILMATSFVLSALLCYANDNADAKAASTNASAETRGITVIDGRGKQVAIPQPLKRVVSVQFSPS
jgi:ABC-type Fe3+-hydroxamate transport system substrate-binding protein